MCDELGDDQAMTAYITDFGKTSLCSTETLKGCNEKEAAYIGKMKSKSMDDITAQLSRLEGMNSASMKEDLKDWLERRIKILSELAKSGQHGEL
mmetsp:Transcript_10244/g.12431  ORF Transcript_10244/g.12431 Transcript_10244/m.12431 type:complete len:94 (-) Transcript_10244:264-545(-)